ncbi:MAG: amino-acid N-acetyltransferase [Verrucomicrobiota bacterium]
MNFGDLRGILQYVPYFRDQTFVVALDGGVAASENFSNVLLDLAVLHSLNMRVVLVHGAGWQMARLAEERGQTLSNADGTGPTDLETMELASDAIPRLSNRLLQGLQIVKLRAVMANVLTAHPLGVVKGIDYQRTGKVGKVDALALRTFLDQGMIPVIPPLAADHQGQSLRLNSDQVAADVAVALQAHKILYLSREPVLDADERGRLPQLSVEEALEMAKQAKEPLTSRLRLAALACERGVSRVHFVDGMQNEALLAELFSNEGIGMMIHADEYLGIRPLRESDVPELLALIHRSVENDTLVRRTQEDVLRRIEDYFVVEIDGNVVGSAALHKSIDEGIGEVACLYIKKSHENRGYGRALLRFAEKEAREAGLSRLAALSVGAKDFFERHGFALAGLEALPEKRRRLAQESSRNAHVLVKKL